MTNIQHTQYIKYYNDFIILYITLYYVFDIVTRVYVYQSNKLQNIIN